jgi:hypothetical protein
MFISKISMEERTYHVDRPRLIALNGGEVWVVDGSLVETVDLFRRKYPMLARVPVVHDIPFIPNSIFHPKSPL